MITAETDSTPTKYNIMAPYYSYGKSIYMTLNYNMKVQVLKSKKAFSPYNLGGAMGNQNFWEGEHIKLYLK